MISFCHIVASFDFLHDLMIKEKENIKHLSNKQKKITPIMLFRQLLFFSRLICKLGWRKLYHCRRYSFLLNIPFVGGIKHSRFVCKNWERFSYHAAQTENSNTRDIQYAYTWITNRYRNDLDSLNMNVILIVPPSLIEF